MRTLVDANVVLRYLLHDDVDQFPIAEQTIREGAHLLPEVLAEVVYVLLAAYNTHFGDSVVSFDRKLNRLLK